MHRCALAFFFHYFKSEQKCVLHSDIKIATLLAETPVYIAF